MCGWDGSTEASNSNYRLFQQLHGRHSKVVCSLDAKTALFEHLLSSVMTEPLKADRHGISLSECSSYGFTS